MAVVKVLARGWTLEVETAVPATFAPVLGLTSFSFDGSKNDADTTTFDSDGVEEHLVASRGRSIGFEGQFLEDPADGTRDPGQELMETAAEAIGQDSLVNFKLTSPGGTVKTFAGSVNVSGLGGGNNDPTGWSGEVKVSGAVVTA